MRHFGAILGAVALSLTLAACGDDKPSGGGGGGAPAPAAMTSGDCKDAGSALGYVDQRQKALMADVKANKPGVGDKFNAFLAFIAPEADKARASNDWVAYCKLVDSHLTAAGY